MYDILGYQCESDQKHINLSPCSSSDHVGSKIGIDDILYFQYKHNLQVVGFQTQFENRWQN